MAHILTDLEAAEAVRVSSSSEIPNFSLIMQGMDADINASTGHDWAADSVIEPIAKIAAVLYLRNAVNGDDVQASYIDKIVKLRAIAMSIEVT